ncbi:hypothetical protein BDZ90DRAFT_252816 [Jaminaea rosea]|uniref:Uncharacterized protein n=1 Tax=Jaminaea rosea TaxID=1569628 RepID=A0A316UUF0_9BASI|nr:hypothetical protein BDZ90DRAFT_252816 [Jaminaea rosea]PWN27533.1 hypothetical protein BDZ90DRAFT_252816 [Jaminaea rosea]
MTSFDPGGHAGLLDLPTELLSYIIRLVYLDSMPRSWHRNLDLHGLPSTYADGRAISSSHSRVQATLWSLCLVCHATYNEARPLLYRRINVSLPHSFTLLLRTLGAAALATAYERFQQTGKLPDDAQSMVAAAGFARVLGTSLVMTEDEVRGGRSREASSSSTPAPTPATTGEGAALDDDHLQLTWQSDSSRFTVSLRQLSELQDCVRVIDFSAFTTQGMRRTIGQGMEARFVTPPRLLALLTAAPNLAAFGASQTMDSSLSVEVLEALLFRGGKAPHRPARLRGVSVERNNKKKRRRTTHKIRDDDGEGEAVVSLSALDLTDCVSPVFEGAVTEFIARHLNARVTHTLHEESSTDTETTADEGASTTGDEESDVPRSSRGSGSRSSALIDADRSRGRSVRSLSRAPPAPRSTSFPDFERLSLNGIIWRPALLSPFLRAFTGLTHLDVSRTRIDADLLGHLSASPSLHLESLSLAGCRNLTSEGIAELLIDSPVTADLAELSLEGSLVFPTPLERHHLAAILSEAPCFRSGRFRYLDIGGCGCDDELLLSLAPQPFLLDLGLGASPGLTLSVVSRFLRERAPNVQVLELSDSCYHPGSTSGVLALDVATQLIGPCCTTPPLPLSLQLAQMGFAGADQAAKAAAEATAAQLREPTNLRVVGLNGPSLRNVRAGFGSWKVIWGSGKRGWLVDTSAGPSPDAKDSDLDPSEGGEGEAEEQTGSPPARAAGLKAPAPPARRSRSRRRMGYEPETPPLGRSPSRHRSLNLGHNRSRSQGPAGSPHSTLLRGASFSSSLRPPSPTPPESKPPPAPPPVPVRPEIVRNLPSGHPRRSFLENLAAKSSTGGGGVSSEVGWHARKMETLLGFGMLGRERGCYAFVAYC